MTTHLFPNDPLALLFDPNAALPTIVQGITGRMGRKHAALMRAYGTEIVGGTAPAGSKSADLKDVEGAPVFRSCAEAVKATGAVASVAMVPPFEVLAAIREAVEGGIKLIVTVTEGMPVADAIRARALVQAADARWVGASTPRCGRAGSYQTRFYSISVFAARLSRCDRQKRHPVVRNQSPSGGLRPWAKRLDWRRRRCL
jgi:succinyl-CoA synthetase alpha subunit